MREEKRRNMPWRRRQEIPDAQVLDAADQYEAASRVLWAQLSEGGILTPIPLPAPPEAKVTEGVSIDDFSTWRAVRFAKQDEVG